MPPPMPPHVPPGTHPKPLNVQTLGHMQLMLGYSTAPEYVHCIANVIVSDVSGWNATAPSGLVTRVWGGSADGPEALMTVWG